MSAALQGRHDETRLVRACKVMEQRSPTPTHEDSCTRPEEWRAKQDYPQSFVLMTSVNSSVWLPTSRAAQAIGCTPEHLKRQRDSHGGFLEAGAHYSLGPSLNSPIRWDVEAVRIALHRRGMKLRASCTTRKEVG